MRVTDIAEPDTATSSGRREERKAQNRAKLLAAARKVFAEKGLGAATARDIVRETDLATGTFYNYFDSKEEVFTALIDELAAKARAAVRAQRREPGRTVEQRVEAAYRAYFELVIAERELFEVFRRNAGSITMMADRDRFEESERELFEDLADWSRAGEMPEVDLELLAQAMVGAGVHVANHLFDTGAPDPETAARFCAQLFLGGIRALG
jgi:AcrR family transcriptional regulator